MKYSAIILCAGSGTRTGLKYNKMFFKLDNQTVYEKTLSLFLQDERCQQIIVVTKPEEQDDFKQLSNDNRIEFVYGGKERQDSVYEGLKSVNEDYVMIHDGARPYLTIDLIDHIVETLQIHDACLPMVKAKDTIKQVIDGKVIKTLNRDELYQAQTPQSFKTSLIKYAYEEAFRNNAILTDDASTVELLGHDVYIVEGDYNNIKITTKEDLKKQ